ncbi:2Fe-2S iron-sulfur cluster-binding protein [Streptomyces sp. NPDC016309]|uniref:2Fe-2S iron-sulfur cluster-binding protein n=1 Tax=Streptomyces sp. NPDC016309 TaxID=3364965 RepID=UPI0036FE661F
MTTDENDDRQGRGGWQPTPQGEYDSDATAFVQLPPDMASGAPLEAPGHGYVPPEAWAPHDPNATSQWSYPAPAPTELTGQWTIPVAQGDIPDESGEFTTSALASQWTGGNPPATLPGGAAAPWATPEPHGAGEPAPRAPETAQGGAPAAADPAAHPEPVPAHDPHHAPAHDPHHAPADEPHPDPHHAPAHDPHHAPADEPHPDPHHDRAPDPHAPAHDPDADAGAPREAHPESGTEVHREPHHEAAGHESQRDAAPAPTQVTGSEEHPHVSYVLRVNGSDRPVTEAWIGESLLYVLRERLGLAGAKDGCSQGECGACNVQVDGRLVASCLVPAATAAGSEVRTVEGLATDGEPSDVQRALAGCGAVQCGFCIPGMAMTVHDLLEGNHAPTELETRQALCGNLCRCTGYRGVLDAVRQVVDERTAAAAAAAETPGPAPGADGPGGGAQARIPHQIPHPHDGGTA